MDFVATLGPWMYPLAGVAALLLLDIVRAAIAIATAEPAAASPPHHTVLGWGVLAGVVGFLGTVVGFGRVAVGARAATGAERAELEGMLELMWEGVGVIVTPTIAGLALFTAALVAWLGLQYALMLRLR